MVGASLQPSSGRRNVPIHSIFKQYSTQSLERDYKYYYFIIRGDLFWIHKLSYLAGGAVVDFFAKNNAQVETIALYGFRIVATSFLMMAYNVFASGWFTALNDGKTSAILSFCRTVIFMIAPVLILPGIFGMDGVWMSITAGEVLSILMSIFYFRKYRNMWSVKV